MQVMDATALLERPAPAPSGSFRQPSAARTKLQLVDPAVGAIAPPWHDKLQGVPAMRSALMPLAAEETAEWSSPFSLIKADFEPWLSYYAGYRSSRLFLQAAGGQKQAALCIDHPVRALLELKKLDARLIVEPVVQIDAPVEYFDAARAAGAGRDAGLAESLARAADAMHRSQLRRAQERGREMGNALHEALLGDGLSNLIRACEKAWLRKPTPHELHLMLTTGRAAQVNVAVAATAPAARPMTGSTLASAGANPVASRAAVPSAEGTAGDAMPAARRQERTPQKPESIPSSVSTGQKPVGDASEPASSSSAGSGARYLIHLVGAAGLAGLIYLLVQ